jgi:hypothetical protein
MVHNKNKRAQPVEHFALDSLPADGLFEPIKKATFLGPNFAAQAGCKVLKYLALFAC